MQLCDLSAVEIRDHISSKQASAVEVLGKSELCSMSLVTQSGRSNDLRPSSQFSVILVLFLLPLILARLLIIQLPLVQG